VFIAEQCSQHHTKKHVYHISLNVEHK